MSRNPAFSYPEHFGDYCDNDCGRYCLPGDKATCTHKAICEDCWPNGCGECEWEADRLLRLSEGARRWR